MSINLAGYTFEGPFVSTSSLKDQSGVYVILGYRDGSGYWIYVGESGEVKTRVTKHDGADCWRKVQREKGYTELKVAALYVNKPSRMNIESKIIEDHKPPCNKE